MGDKTPLHTWHVDGMARLYPDAQFIGMMRHPGGNVGSNMNRFGHPYGRAVHHVERYDREIARQAAQHKRQFVVLRYEDLVLRPEPVLRELLDWLGEPWSDQVLQHHEVQTARGGRLVVEGTNRIDDPIDVSRVAKWHGRMSHAHRHSLTTRLGRLSEFYGYDMNDPAVLAPVGAKLVITGEEIDARIDAFPHLDLSREGRAGTRRTPIPPGPHAALRHRRAGQEMPTPPDPPFHVRLWRVMPQNVRRQCNPALRKLRRRVIHARRRLRRR